MCCTVNALNIMVACFTVIIIFLPNTCCGFTVYFTLRQDGGSSKEAQPEKHRLFLYIIMNKVEKEKCSNHWSTFSVSFLLLIISQKKYNINATFLLSSKFCLELTHLCLLGHWGLSKLTDTMYKSLQMKFRSLPHIQHRMALFIDHILESIFGTFWHFWAMFLCCRCRLLHLKAMSLICQPQTWQ